MSDFIAVESSNITHVRYDEALSVLYVRFKNKKIWGYYDVSQTVYDKFMEAKSKGAFFATHIKPIFKAEEFADEEDGEEYDDHGIIVLRSNRAGKATEAKKQRAQSMIYGRCHCGRVLKSFDGTRVICPVAHIQEKPKEPEMPPSIRMGKIDL